MAQVREAAEFGQLYLDSEFLLKRERSAYSGGAEFLMAEEDLGYFGYP